MDSWHSRPQADLFQELDARPGGLTRRQAEERSWPGTGRISWSPQAAGAALPDGPDEGPMILVLPGRRGCPWRPAGERLAGCGHHPGHRGGEQHHLHLPGDHAHRALEELRKMTSPRHRPAGARPSGVGGGGAGAGGRSCWRRGTWCLRTPACWRRRTAPRRERNDWGVGACGEGGGWAAAGVTPPWETDQHGGISGTLVTAGRATALVTATGMDTDGPNAGLLLRRDPAHPSSGKMGISIPLSLPVPPCAVMFGVGLLQGKDIPHVPHRRPWRVAAIPEGPARHRHHRAGPGAMADRGPS